MRLVSIIIATYNRANLLSKALDSILSQKFNKDWNVEIVVIDNHSTDSTRKTVEEIAALSRIPIKYFFESSRGKGFALNRGIKESKGEILVFTDDDIEADASWLENLINCFETYQCDSVGGRVLPDYPPGSPQWVINNAKILVGPIVCYDYGEINKPYQSKVMYEFLGANFAFKRSIFDELGHFLTDIGPGKSMMGEDTEMLTRLIRTGKRMHYCGQALVWHPVDRKRMSLSYIAKWNMCLGIYRVIADEKSMPPNLKYIFGYPSYLVRIMAIQISIMAVSLFDRDKFLKTWIDFFVNVGKAKQIREFNFKLERGASRNELFCQCDHLYV